MSSYSSNSSLTSSESDAILRATLINLSIVVLKKDFGDSNEFIISNMVFESIMPSLSVLKAFTVRILTYSLLYVFILDSIYFYIIFRCIQVINMVLVQFMYRGMLIKKNEKKAHKKMLTTKFVIQK